MGAMLAADMGERIRTRREHMGLTQRDVAHALQVSNQAVSKWERGENAPDIETLAGLGRLLGVSVDFLLGTHGREGEIFEATVFLSDVRGFSVRYQGMPERDGAVWLNGMLTQITEAVLRHDGVPVKYMGDAVLAFFAGAEHRDRAMRAVLLGRQIMGENFAAGLHSGPIFLGRIGHPDYAARDVIGPTMIVAFRSQQWANQSSTHLVATGDVASGIVSDDLRARLSEPVSVTLKAIEHPILIHEIQPLPGGS
jgi:class 3 adenylate cyclase